MSMGRGSALAMSLLLCLLLLIIHSSDRVNAATYTVGGPTGWNFNIASWPKGKRFKTGDILVFNYNSGLHNVVGVNRGGYSSCIAPARAKVLTSGSDKVKLRKGENYFICSVAGHCQNGMKMAINAA